jgi:hypothetical protein
MGAEYPRKRTTNQRFGIGYLQVDSRSSAFTIRTSRRRHLRLTSCVEQSWLLVAERSPSPNSSGCRTNTPRSDCPSSSLDSSALSADDIVRLRPGPGLTVIRFGRVSRRRQKPERKPRRRARPSAEGIVNFVSPYTGDQTRERNQALTVSVCLCLLLGHGDPTCQAHAVLHLKALRFERPAGADRLSGGTVSVRLPGAVRFLRGTRRLRRW